jgi:hypothetical protein
MIKLFRRTPLKYLMFVVVITCPWAESYGVGNPCLNLPGTPFNLGLSGDCGHVKNDKRSNVGGVCCGATIEATEGVCGWTPKIKCKNPQPYTTK